MHNRNLRLKLVVIMALLATVLTSVPTMQAQDESPNGSEDKTQIPLNWDQGDIRTPFYYSVRDTNGNFMWDARNWWPTLYDGRTLDELNQSWFRPGHGTVLIDEEEHGNILMICHSGTLDQNPLQCEEWRRYFEPLGDFWFERTPTLEEQVRMDSIRAERMLDVIGWRVRMVEGNSPEVMFEVVGVSYIPHEEVEEFRADTKVVLNFLLENAEDPEPWETSITSADQHIILVFCGWGPYTAETVDDWGTWTRYGLLLRQVNPNSDE